MCTRPRMARSERAGGGVGGGQAEAECEGCVGSWVAGCAQCRPALPAPRAAPQTLAHFLGPFPRYFVKTAGGSKAEGMFKGEALGLKAMFGEETLSGRVGRHSRHECRLWGATPGLQDLAIAWPSPNQAPNAPLHQCALAVPNPHGPRPRRHPHRAHPGGLPRGAPPRRPRLFHCDGVPSAGGRRRPGGAREGHGSHAPGGANGEARGA
jgi:hypothetical protein